MIGSSSPNDTTTATLSKPSAPQEATRDPITTLLSRLGTGDRQVFDQLIPLVYRELRDVAERYLRREAQNHTLQPTALIHEAYIKLLSNRSADYKDRTHFLAVAARAMRQILVDHARARQAAKRSSAAKVTLDEDIDFAPERAPALVAVDDALTALAKANAQRAQLVELRFFAGMTAENISEFLAIPVNRVRRELLIAQAWLRGELRRESGG